MKTKKTLANHLPMATLTSQLERHFPLPDYLVNQHYEKVSSRIFVKPDSPEIIRVTKRQGKIFFRNFLIRGDRGTALDFLRHRAHTEGKIIPNREEACQQKAVAKVTAYFLGYMFQTKRRPASNEAA